jgi:hypothetical protein
LRPGKTYSGPEKRIVRDRDGEKKKTRERERETKRGRGKKIEREIYRERKRAL